MRKEFLISRKSIDKHEKEILNSKIFDHVKQSDAYKKSNIILSYVSTECEVDTLQLIDYSLNANKIVAVPVTDFITRTMTFIEIKNVDDLVKIKHGIREPLFDISKSVELSQDCLCIVPGIAFNSKGYRIGYGGGFYDRFLSDFCGYSIGLCFQRFLAETLETESHDIAVNFIATEHGIFSTNQSIRSKK